MINNIPVDLRKKSGIYIIRSTINNKIYIGSALNLCARYRRHKHDLLNNNHHSKHLQCHYNKHGQESLSFDLHEICDKSCLLIVEQKYLDEYKPFGKRGFNTYVNAKSPKGLKMTQASIDKQRFTKIKNRVYEDISKRMTGAKRPNHREGFVLSDETKKKISNKRKGQKHTEQSIEKIRAASLARRHTFESKKKMSIARKKISEDKNQLKLF